jgi:signal transduction histidine kinase
MPTVRRVRQVLNDFKKGRLLGKLIRFVLPLLVSAIALTALLLSWTSYLSFKNTIRDDYANMVKSSAGEIRAFLNKAQTGLESMAWVLAATKLDRWRQEMALTAFHQVATEFIWLALMPVDGESPLEVGQDVGGGAPERLEIYHEALAGRMATSKVNISKENVPYVIIGTQVRRLGQVEQVLLAELNVKAVWDVLEGVQIGESGTISILDAAGKLVGHREMDRVINSRPYVPPEILAKLNEPPVAPIEWSEKREDGTYYCVGYYLSLIGWFIVLSQRESEIYSHLYENFWLALAVTLAACLAAMALSWARIRSFLLPVEMLHGQAQKYGRGELEERVAITSEDEIGELGKAFNDMADSLERYIRREVETAQELAHARNLATLGAASSKVTHEVGNLLNVMGFALNRLKEDTLSPGSVQTIALMEKDAGRVKAFIQDFLQFARKPKLNLERVPLEPMLRELAYGFREQAEGKGLELHLEWPPGLPEVLMEQRLMRQVFNNLLKNSIEATGERGRIVITGSVIEDLLQVTVADTGPGISPDIRDRIFEPFFTTKGKQGTGLGLAICKTIVEAHRGTIDCESEPEKGTVFILNLPIR